MYKSGETRKSGSFNEVSQYIEDHDVYNSKLLRVLVDPSITRVSYMITKYEYRPDLIAEDIYGSSEYCGLLMAQLRLSLNGFVRGNVLRIIPKKELDNIILNL